MALEVQAEREALAVQEGFCLACPGFHPPRLAGRRAKACDQQWPWVAATSSLPAFAAVAWVLALEEGVEVLVALAQEPAGSQTLQ